jgi:hypothetical protein
VAQVAAVVVLITKTANCMTTVLVAEAAVVEFFQVLVELAVVVKLAKTVVLVVLEMLVVVHQLVTAVVLAAVGVKVVAKVVLLLQRQAQVAKLLKQQITV